MPEIIAEAVKAVTGADRDARRGSGRGHREPEPIYFSDEDRARGSRVATQGCTYGDFKKCDHLLLMAIRMFLQPTSGFVKWRLCCG